MAMKIGLTGSIACGKSTISAYLRELGYAVIDADAISRAITAPGGKALPALRKAFGDTVFRGDILDRRALGAMVFSDPEKRESLNELLHPMIISEIEAQLRSADASGAPVFCDVPLLYECGMESMFDLVWVVSVSYETQIARLMERDGLSLEEAQRRIAAQMSLEEKRLRADAVICSEGTIEETRAQVRALIADAHQRRQA